MVDYPIEQSISIEKASPWWKDIRTVCFPISESCWFDNLLSRKLGEGNGTRFWTDNWADGAVLSNRFDRLFRLSNQQNFFIKDMGIWENNVWNWQFEWRRELRSVELVRLEHLKQVLDQFVLREGVDDTWVWLADVGEGYTVKSAYSFLQGTPNDEPDQVFTTLWSIPAPSNPKAFLWRVFWNRVQTKDNLRKRGILAAEEDIRCPFCQQSEESLEHLLFSCDFAHSVWKACYKWMGLYTVLPVCSKMHFLQHVQLGFNKKARGALWAVWCVVLWSLWLHRNSVIFRNESPNMEGVLELAILRAWSWLSAKIKEFRCSLFEWFSLPMQCIAQC